MAIRERKDRGKWQVYWTNPWTKKRESVFCDNKHDAQKTDAQIKFRLTWEKESFRPAEEDGKKEADTTFGGMVYAYLQDRKLPKSGIRNTLYGTADACRVFSDTPIDSITQRDIATLLRVVSSKHSGTTTRTLMARTRTVFMWAKKHGYLETIPTWPDIPNCAYRHFVPPSPEELAQVMAVASEHIRRIVIIGSKLGLRVGPCELLKLKWSDIDLDRGVVHVRASRKNRMEPLRDVPIKASLIDLFRTWKSDDEANGVEWVVHYHGKPIDKPQAAWHRALKRAGITRRIRLYDLRHAFATDAIAAGADVGTVAKLMGHANANMVLKHYQHVLTSQKKAAIEALPDIPILCPNGCAQNVTEIFQ